MLKFETYELNESITDYNEFREEIIDLEPIKPIEVKVVHKESLDIEVGFDGRVNNYNGYTLCKDVMVGNILTKDVDKLRVVWVDHNPRLSTLILERL